LAINAHLQFAVLVKKNSVFFYGFSDENVTRNKISLLVDAWKCTDAKICDICRDKIFSFVLK